MDVRPLQATAVTVAFCSGILRSPSESGRAVGWGQPCCPLGSSSAEPLPCALLGLPFPAPHPLDPELPFAQPRGSSSVPGSLLVLLVLCLSVSAPGLPLLQCACHLLLSCQGCPCQLLFAAEAPFWPPVMSLPVRPGKTFLACPGKLPFVPPWAAQTGPISFP